MDQAEIAMLLASLRSKDDASRKLAVFNLQASINDPSFADIFISSGGLEILAKLIMITSGNTLAYALAALSRLLEVEMGWEIFEMDKPGTLVERVVELIVTNPLVNILRGATSILVAVVTRSQNSSSFSQVPGTFGFRALEPAVAQYPHFFEMVVSQLNSADHLLCANSLMLLNALMRDTISNDKSANDGPGKATVMAEDWPSFNRKLQDLGIVQAVYDMMQKSSLQDMAHSLFEFQTISKMLLKRLRDIEVDLKNPGHQSALDTISSSLEKMLSRNELNLSGITPKNEPDNEREWAPQKKPLMWRNLGFQTETPMWEFEATGFLGMMDLINFVSRDEDGFQMLLLEHTGKSPDERFPIARASLSVTEILYDHFEIGNSDLNDSKSNTAFDDRKCRDNLLRPLVLHWSRLHTKALRSFFSLWKQTGADLEDYGKVVDLLRVLVDQVVGGAPRTKVIEDVEEKFQEFDYHQLRELQMDLLDMEFEEEWSQHLSHVRDELRNESLQFMKEQRIRALLQGAWFPQTQPNKINNDDHNSEASSLTWRYVKLSHNRRYLHFANFNSQTAKDPPLEALTEKIDIGSISSVISDNVAPNGNENTWNFTPTSIDTPRPLECRVLRDSSPIQITRITINSHLPTPDGKSQNSDITGSKIVEQAILTLILSDHSLASDWLDGLLMLLNQAPITDETNKLVDVISDYGLKIRLLNVRLGNEFTGPPEGAGIVPSREGLDDDYFYEI